MKNLLSILTLFLLTNLAFAQNGTISGSITDKKRQLTTIYKKHREFMLNLKVFEY
ncbi:MAG: hypothetical protein ACWIPJ_02690 [Polaribacter sp.]